MHMHELKIKYEYALNLSTGKEFRTTSLPEPNGGL